MKSKASAMISEAKEMLGTAKQRHSMVRIDQIRYGKAGQRLAAAELGDSAQWQHLIRQAFA